MSLTASPARTRLADLAAQAGVSTATVSRALRGLPRELERVTRDVGELHDLVALVVVSEHEHALPERRLGSAGGTSS